MPSAIRAVLQALVVRDTGGAWATNLSPARYKVVAMLLPDAWRDLSAATARPSTPSATPAMRWWRS